MICWMCGEKDEEGVCEVCYEKLLAGMKSVQEDGVHLRVEAIKVRDILKGVFFALMPDTKKEVYVIEAEEPAFLQMRREVESQLKLLPEIHQKK